MCRCVFSIRTSHILFGGRATIFQGAWPWDKSKYTDETNEDWDGHGTHIAGTIGAKNYGVAPFANLISVKVLGEGGDLRLVAQVCHPLMSLSANGSRYLGPRLNTPNPTPPPRLGHPINLSFLLILVYLERSNFYDVSDSNMFCRLWRT